MIAMYCKRLLQALIVPVLIAAPCLLWAQAKDNTHYGIKAGINFAELVGDDAIPESDRKTGYSFGAYMTLKVNDHFKIQPEAFWSLQGEKTENNGRYKISYLNIPCMFKWVEGNFYTELGPQLGIITINTSKSVPEEMKLENFETFELAVNAGLGYMLDENWTIGARYSHALTNLVEGMDIRGSVIYIGIAYRVF